MTLRCGSPDDIVDMFNRMRIESRGIIKDIISLVYFMRGSIQYEDMLLRTPIERELISEFISERIEIESTHPHPVY